MDRVGKGGKNTFGLAAKAFRRLPTRSTMSRSGLSVGERGYLLPPPPNEPLLIPPKEPLLPPPKEPLLLEGVNDLNDLPLLH